MTHTQSHTLNTGFIYSSDDCKRKFREAFARAKKAFKPVLKNQENPFFHSRYASLSDIHEAIDDALLMNGFTLHQPLEADEVSNFLLTKLCHIDGHEEVSRVRILTKDDSDPQKLKSAITYLRRSSLEALLGIAAEDDDDGNKAADLQKPAASASPPSKAVSSTIPKNGKLISEAQVKRFYAISKAHQWDPAAALQMLKKWNYKLPDEIQWPHYQEICQALEKGPGAFSSKPGLTTPGTWNKDAEQPPPYQDEDIPF